MSYSLVIFDLDGTLLNSLEDLADAVNYALEKNGLPTHPISAYNLFVGNGINNLLERSLPSEISFSSESFFALRNDFVTYYESHKEDKTKPYDGILELLETLASKNIQMAIASNKYHEAVLPLVEKNFQSIPFEVVYGHRDGKPGKPDPSIVYDILEITKKDKAEVLFVGDSSVDMLTAKNAGIKAIGVTWGFRSEEELKENGADFIVHQPNEILGII